MAIVLNITSVPQTFAAGTFDAAAVTLNTGIWRVTITPAEPSTAYVGGTFRAVLGLLHGGLWFNDNKLELYTTPNDDLAFSIPVTFSADQPIFAVVDTRAGSRRIKISDATTGNGDFPFTIAGPYIDPAEDLGIGKMGSGNLFQYLGGISPIDDGVTVDSIDPASLVLAGESIGELIAITEGVIPSTIILSGSNVTEGLGAISDDVIPASITLAGDVVLDQITYRDTATAATLVISGQAVNEGIGAADDGTPASLTVIGQTIQDRKTTIDTPLTAQVTLIGATISEHVGHATNVAPAHVELTGGNITDHIDTGSSTSVSPAAVLLIGGVTTDQHVRIDTMQPAVIQVRGGQIGSLIEQAPPTSVFEVPPGRAPDRLFGTVQTPSIESREAEQGHLFGVVRSAKDV